MKNIQRLLVAGIALCMMTLSAAQSPIGTWKTIDDETQQAKSLVQIYQKPDGTLAGKVLKLLQKPGTLCSECDGDKKNQPIEGMDVLWGLKADDGIWDKGTILDPKNGKTYRAEIAVIDGGKSLKVTGKVLMFSRSQIWHREQ